MSRSEYLTVIAILTINIISKVYALDPRIVGGAPAVIETFPYLVNIAYKKNHKCGGSYIQTVWVLTAAHCIEDAKRIKKTTCRMGMTYLRGDDRDKAGVQMKKAKEFIRHPHYNKADAINDVGLIRIDSAFKASNTVGRIKLATKPYTDYSTLCVVSGWGLTHEDDRKLPNQLRYVELPIMPQKQCCKYYPVKLNVQQFMDGKILCAGYKSGGHDACAGDSGGPFVCGDTQVGIVSWGVGCGSTLPGVYVNVTTYFSWIKGVIRKKNILSSGKSSSVTYRSKFYIAILASLATCCLL